jgi:cell division septation protein DedD
MPRFNLKDDETNPEASTPGTGGFPSTPALREIGGGGGRISPIFLILLILVLLAAGVFALNYFKVIDLWGKKAPVVTDTLPEPDLPPPDLTSTGTAEGTAGAGTAATGTGTGTEALPLPEAKPKPSVTSKPDVAQKSTSSRDLSIVPTGSGKYTIQFSAWNTKAKAEDQAARLVGGGYEAYVDESAYEGTTWFRVRVGRYDSRSQARDVIARLQHMTEDEVWVASQRPR